MVISPQLMGNSYCFKVKVFITEEWCWGLRVSILMIASKYTKCIIFVLNNQQNTRQRPFSGFERAAWMNLKKCYRLIFPRDD